MKLLRAAIAALFGLALVQLAQVSRDAAVSVRIVDATTGRPTPARVHFEDSHGTRPRARGALAVSETAIPIPKQALAVMWGQQDMAQGYALQPDGSFYVDGGFDARVPPGDYTVAISKGFEYAEQRDTIHVDPGGSVAREYRLARWIDMPRRGWYSSDDHIHLRRSPGDNDNILRWVAAEDIQVGNILQMGDFWAFYFSQYAFGEPGRYEEDGRVIASGQEEPRTPEIGHTISLGASGFVRAARDYYSFDRLFDRVHALGGVTGFAHQGMSFHGYRGMALNTLRGKTDFLELAQFCVAGGPLITDHYYQFLDLGYKLTALAGSDFPWCGHGPEFGFPAPQIAQIGNARFYTYVDGGFSFDRWLAAMKAGHTFVTTGPMLFLTVNGKGPGDTLDIAPGTRVRVEAEAFGHDVQVPLRSLEIIAHGSVLGRAAASSRTHLSADVELTPDRGLWIAARCDAGNGQVAHTTPVYVTLNGGGFENPATLRRNIDAAESYLKEIEDTLAHPGPGPDEQAGRHRAQLERQIAEAREKLKSLAAR